MSSLCTAEVQCLKASSSGAREVLTGVRCSLQQFSAATRIPQTVNNRHQCSVHVTVQGLHTASCCSCVAGHIGERPASVAEGTVSLSDSLWRKREGGFCFCACFKILPLPTSLKVGGVFSWAVTGFPSLPRSCLYFSMGVGRSWGMPFTKKGGGLFLLW